MQSVTFAVKCPRDIARVYEMTIYLAKLNDGTLIPSPCFGCENDDNSSTCNACKKSIFSMSRKEPQMTSYSKPIIPEMN